MALNTDAEASPAQQVLTGQVRDALAQFPEDLPLVVCVPLDADTYDTYGVTGLPYHQRVDWGDGRGLVPDERFVALDAFAFVQALRDELDITPIDAEASPAQQVLAGQVRDALAQFPDDLPLVVCVPLDADTYDTYGVTGLPYHQRVDWGDGRGLVPDERFVALDAFAFVQALRDELDITPAEPEPRPDTR